jgi:energy-coupling factor transport system ATP-binding protein
MSEKPIRGRELKMRDWILNALCIAIGAMTRIYGVSFGPYMISATPGTVVAGLYLTRPRLREALGIAIVTGLVNTLTSKAAFPANWFSDPIALMVFWVVFSRQGFAQKGHLYKAIEIYLVTTACLYIDWILFFVGVAIALGIPWIGIVAWLPGMTISSAIYQPIAAEVLYFAAERIYKPT